MNNGIVGQYPREPRYVCFILSGFSFERLGSYRTNWRSRILRTRIQYQIRRRDVRRAASRVCAPRSQSDCKLQHVCCSVFSASMRDRFDDWQVLNFDASRVTLPSGLQHDILLHLFREFGTRYVCVGRLWSAILASRPRPYIYIYIFFFFVFFLTGASFLFVVTRGWFCDCRTDFYELTMTSRRIRSGPNSSDRCALWTYIAPPFLPSIVLKTVAEKGQIPRMMRSRAVTMVLLLMGPILTLHISACAAEYIFIVGPILTSAFFMVDAAALQSNVELIHLSVV